MIFLLPNCNALTKLNPLVTVFHPSQPSDRCTPPQVHPGCPSDAPPGLFGTCASTSFDDMCTFYCRPGFSSTAAIRARCSLTSEWQLVTGAPVCNPVPGVTCIANSSPDVAGECQCNDGFRGTPVWDPLTTRWTGTCQAVAYPANSLCSGPGQCRCASGYAGSVVWVRKTQSYTSTCTPVPCPAMSDAASFPACSCLYGGTISFNLASMTWNDNCRVRVVENKCFELPQRNTGTME